MTDTTPPDDALADGVVEDALDVVDFGMTPLTVRVGPCSPWVTRTDIASRPGCSAISTTILDEAAASASELLYEYSGKQFVGTCGPVTVRPVARWANQDGHAWGRFAAGSWLGSSSWFTQGTVYPGIAMAYGDDEIPSVDLGVYPVTNIVSVTIDGTTIPDTEYRLDDFRVLRRVRPTASTVPTVRWGWPTWQRLDLPPTEPGTFAVTLAFGLPPTPAGVLAAKALGAVLAKGASADRTGLPATTTSVARQGVTAQARSMFSKLALGEGCGILEVDAFLAAYNPTGARTPSSVWSPDLDRAQRIR